MCAHSWMPPWLSARTLGSVTRRVAAGSGSIGARSWQQSTVCTRADPAPAGSTHNETPSPSLSQLLGELLPFLRSCPRDIVAPKLKVVLHGPAFPSAESSTSNHARNVMFELTMGYRLWRADLSPQLGEHPDLTCTVDGTPVLVECKRPLSDKTVEKRI